MSETPLPKRAARFRLRTLLLAVVIIALCVSQFVAIRYVRDAQATNRQLSDEIAKLRTEAGYLNVKDPSKVYLVRIPTIDELTWRWRVHLPAGEWELQSATRGITRNILPEFGDYAPLLGSQEVIITVGVRKAPDGKWQLVTLAGPFHMRQTLADSNPMALPEPRETETSIAGFGGDEEVSDPNKPVVLLRIRALKDVDTSTPDEANSTPGEGVLVWLERKSTEHDRRLAPAADNSH